MPRKPPASPQEEVVRVYTELVQTDVMVFDKQGKFVNGLTQNDFQLKVDGKPRSIQAFDLIKAGSSEEVQLAAARGGPAAPLTSATRPIPLDRGRTVFFYIDDFHLDVEGFSAAKKVLRQFIDNELGQNDQVAISAASGQLAFLQQQLTNNRSVLDQALERLSPRQYSVRDSDRPPMGEYEALLIDINDYDVFDVFVTDTLRVNPGMSRNVAEATVRARAQGLLSQAGAFTTYTLSGLEKLVRSLSAIPGRKVVFVLSNGFHIQNRRGDALQQVKQVTAAAAKSGVVIYSLDVRGLVAELDHDLSADRMFDTTGRLQRAMRGELLASQDGLNALARDTGGRPFFNTNDFRQGVATAVKETSVYYLLAWKPEVEQQPKPGRFRNIEVSVVGRPDLTVRVRRGFFDVDPTPPVRAEADVNASKQIPTKLRDTIVAPFPQAQLPILLNAFYHDTVQKGSTAVACVQIPGEFMTFGPQDGKTQAIIDVSGVFYNLSGNPVVSFLERIVTTAPDAEAAKSYRKDITYSYPASLKPGLYQVRVAARDDKSGRIGSAFTWIEVPDLTTRKLTLSSLILAERTQSMMTNISNSSDITPLTQSASQRFRRQSKIRFVLFTYNTEPSPVDGKPDVAVQVQVLRDDQPVITTALRRVNTEGVVDLARLPYAAEISLENLTPGQYVLHVSVIDRLSKQSSIQETHFEVY
ncbi:MAG TPA: VWA domain-containing protein [Pyrinomonadaceae bacterium]